jgi:hypothetical protein
MSTGAEIIARPVGTPSRSLAAIELPAPTAWPIVLAFGLTLIFAGLVTSASVSILGAILAIAGSAGWFREALPHEKLEAVPVTETVPAVSTRRMQVTQVEWMSQEVHRARLPLEIYPISAGVKGGLTGSVVMALVAMLYGFISGHGIWYPVNLLSAGFFPERSSVAQIAAFRWDALIIATIVHLVCSLLVGLLYGAVTPIFPRRPILLGGLVAPILWSGLLHSIMEALDPVLNHRIDWLWFVISQIGFGIVAGIVVSRQERVRTWQYLPFVVRAGVETPGAMDPKNGEGPRP